MLGWILVAAKLALASTLYVPPIQAAIGLGFSLLVVRVSGARRRVRRTVTVSVLIVMAVAFWSVPLPPRFVDNTLMADGIERVESRERFERRFPLANLQVNFHSHLGDVAIISLDRFFGASETSQRAAYNALSHLAGLLFLAELSMVGMLYRWSRRACRYVGLAIGTPMASLYFGYWEVGYLAVAVGVVPLLLFRPNRGGVSTQASTMAAGALQGLHTALHGYGILGMAGGALLALRAGTFVRGALRSLTFTSMAVALYLGWIFFYVMQFGWEIVYLKIARLTAAADYGRRRRPVRGAAAVTQRVERREPDRATGRHPAAGRGAGEEFAARHGIRRAVRASGAAVPLALVARDLPDELGSADGDAARCLGGVLGAVCFARTLLQRGLRVRRHALPAVVERWQYVVLSTFRRVSDG